MDVILLAVGAVNIFAGLSYYVLGDDPASAGMCYALAAAAYSMREPR